MNLLAQERVPLGTIQVINGKEQLCYDKEDRLDLIQSLVTCKGYKTAFEFCSSHHESRKYPIYLSILFGAASIGLGVTLLTK